MARMKGLQLHLIALSVCACSITTNGSDNGLGLTPPRGWRSWNAFGPAVNDSVMRAQMLAVVDKSRFVGGKPASLAELGFNWVSMDDGWQKCNCSAPGSLDDRLPKCPDCRGGACSWHTNDKEGGKPVVDDHKFPDMKALVVFGHSLGLKVGSYLNNCVCAEGGDPPTGEHCTAPTHYQQDVDYIISTGFDGVKIDNCGSSHNVTLWAQLFNKTHKPIRIESCHTFHPNNHSPSGWPTFPVWDPAIRAADAPCPMNFYRTGGDISPAFGSVVNEAYAVVQYGDRPDPLSHPGCWAYPDMSEIGNFNGPEPLHTDQEQTHWGLWCILSSPLILGLDMSQRETMDRVWATITNKDALDVNNAWAGQPGTLVKSYPAEGSDVLMRVGQAPCDGSAQTKGWRLEGGKLLAPGKPSLCLGTDHGPPGQDTMQMSTCPPPTRHFHNSGCGHLLGDCLRLGGEWTHNSTTGVLQWQKIGSGIPFGTGQCLTASLPAHVGGFFGGPKAANTAVGQCPPLGKVASNGSFFTFTSKGELRTANGICLAAEPIYGPQLWSKPLPGRRVAVLVVNLAEQLQDFALPFQDVPLLACAGSSCAIRDVWRQKDLPSRTNSLPLRLRQHESGFFIIGPNAEHNDLLVAV